VALNESVQRHSKEEEKEEEEEEEERKRGVRGR